jgi:hypothetical protein
MSSPSLAAPGDYRRRRSRRLLAVALALALHVLLLIFFISSHPHTNVGQGVGVGAMDVSLAGLSRVATASSRPTPATPPRAAAPAKPPRPPDPIKPRSVLAIVSDILSIPLPEQSVTPTPLVAAPSPVVAQAMAQAAGAPGAACDIEGAVQTALQSDPETHGALLLIPRDARSAGHAVMVWNGQWIDPAEPGAVAALTTLRAAIRQIVAAARPDCREQDIVGPRFMLVPDADSTMVAVFGDASWRWSELLVDANEPAPLRSGTN